MARVWVMEYSDGETGGVLEPAFASVKAAIPTFEEEARTRFRVAVDLCGRKIEAHRYGDEYHLRQGYDVLILRPLDVVGALDLVVDPALADEAGQGAIESPAS